MNPIADFAGWPELLTHLLDRNNLSTAQAHAAASAILTGEATPSQLAAFLVALKAKGETSAEMTGLLEGVLDACTVVTLPADVLDRAVDIVGTGGDRSHSINVSTISALVVAGAGVPVCKHGNRASSSKCGSADVLEALGVAIDVDPSGVARCVEQAGIGFCLASRYHGAFRHAGPTRREIGVPTVFNLLGPMANPARLKRQVIGVANPALAERMVSTLQANGSVAAWVVHGSGLDELTTTGTSTVLALDSTGIREFEVDPAALGLAPATADQLVGGDPATNAEAARRVLGGDLGPHRDIVTLNAAAALVVAGVAADLEDGLDRARASIDGGAAAGALDTLVRESNAASAR